MIADLQAFIAWVILPFAAVAGAVVVAILIIVSLMAFVASLLEYED